jgi:hypothetical protein
MSELIFDLHNVTVDDLQEYDLALIAAFIELVGATTAYKKMVEVGVRSFYQYDVAWREFLQAIDRAWNKIVVRCHGEKKWQKLKSKYEKLRKDDPLLKYVAQARNVTENSVSDVIVDWDANLKAQSVFGGIHLSWSHWDRPLLPVINRGTTFLPPKKHLSKSMDYYRKKRPGVEEPRVVAELAIQCYVKMIQEITNEVFPEIKKRNAGREERHFIGSVQML